MELKAVIQWHGIYAEFRVNRTVNEYIIHGQMKLALTWRVELRILLPASCSSS